MERFNVTRVSNEDNSNKSGITLKSFNFMKRASKISLGGEDVRKFSIAQITREAFPRLDNYRLSQKGIKRPSLGELHGEAREQIQNARKESEVAISTHVGIKLGWIEGVVIPCLLNIWGVMLFLRLSWVVAQSGIIESLIIIGISAIVCVITTLSLSAISTNGVVKGGGVYFIISRSLGPEFGASVGIVFAFANAVAASMNTIGFCNSLNDLLGSYNLKIIDGGNNDVRIIGVLTILLLILICCVGMEWEAKAQNFLIVTIVLAILNFLIGTAIGPRGDIEDISKGFVGFSGQTFLDNLGPDYRYSENLNQDFFSVFAIFFPSVTGIQAGANISGDLKNPSKSIPKGTLLALLISMTSYATFVIFAGGAAVRDASGNVDDVVNGMLNHNLSCQFNMTCKYGLENSYSIMQLMSVWGILTYAGCFAATLSTALTNLLSVPRLIQALGLDGIYPGLNFFSKPYGKHGEPYRGYVLTFIISALFVLIAELNVIAPLISNFYLASYALINFCTFHAALIKPLGWRPTFKFYNKWLSLFGFVICISIMFLIDWISSLITFVIIFALYLVVVYRKPDVNWGSSTQAQMYKTAVSSAQKLQTVSDHVKNYRPQVLVLCGDPMTRPPLIDLGHLITKHSSLMVEKLSYKTRLAELKEGEQYLAARKIKAFYTILDGFEFQQGVHALIKASGFGKLAPNIILMGYKMDWMTCKSEELIEYFGVLHKSFSSRMGVVILRLSGTGLDFSSIHHEFKTSNNYETINSQIINIENTNTSNENPNPKAPKTSDILHVDSNLNLAGMISTTSTIIPQQSTESYQINPNTSTIQERSLIYSTQGGSELPQSILSALTIFSRKQSKGTIDVWWLYDDGGLTMLIPYILSTKSIFAGCKIRIFALTNNRMELEVEEKNMANLLAKFRIEYSSITMLQGIDEAPQQTTIDTHKKLIEGFEEGSNTECFIKNTEKQILQEKTYRQLRLHEMVKKFSSDSVLVAMSLPMPRQETVSAPLYMSWLEMLTNTIQCPFMLIRGNQTPVLTFYS